MQTTSILHTHPVTDFLISSRYRLGRHLLLVVLISIIVLFNSAIFYLEAEGQQKHLITGKSFLWFIAYLSAMYLNRYLLVSRFLLQKRYGVYTICYLLIILCLLLIVDLPEYLNGPEDSYSSITVANQVLGISFFYAICLSGSSMPVLFRHWIVSGKRMNELERATVRNELEYLKAQIHPVFLFNVLDQAIALSKMASQQASGLLFKLSKLLRYQLYDSNREWVLLRTEMNYLQGFLELETERREDKKLSFSITEEGNAGRVLIPPLLLAPIVEHMIRGVDEQDKEAFIRIVCRTEDKQVLFSCRGVAPIGQREDDDLANVEQRLKLLFPDAYQLVCTGKGDSYAIQLSLKL